MQDNTRWDRVAMEGMQLAQPQAGYTSYEERLTSVRQRLEQAKKSIVHEVKVGHPASLLWALHK